MPSGFRISNKQHAACLGCDAGLARSARSLRELNGAHAPDPPSLALSCRNALCSAVWEEVKQMADLRERQRKSMNKDVFAYVDSNGEGHLPLNDESHIRNAMARFNQTAFESKTAKEQARRKI